MAEVLQSSYIGQPSMLRKTYSMRCGLIQDAIRHSRLALLVLLLAAVGLMGGDDRVKSRDRRARLPAFKPGDASPFFSDLFTRLRGERPDFDNRITKVPAKPGVTSGTDSPAEMNGTRWSELISSMTIADEVKTLKIAVDSHVTTPSDFAGRGFER